jgi:hypothetical protein
MKKQAGAANHNWKGGNVQKVCEHCGGAFEIIPSRAVKARFCSMKCANLRQSAKPYSFRGDRKKEPRGPVLISKGCRQCGEMFFITWQQRDMTIFCSWDCQMKFRSVHHSGENNPNWLGGIASLPYAVDWPAQRRKALKRDGKKCRNPLCIGTAGRITVHHIDYNKQNCAQDNLITVCAACNTRANFDRNIWSMLYKSLLLFT